MSQFERWLLPDGVDEVLPPLASELEALRRNVLDLFNVWGYDLVIPPFIEYLDSLLTGTGNDLSLQTFKITDQLTGRLMGVRSDFTPQIARIDAHSLKRDGVSRLCYAGSVIHTLPSHQLTTRCPLQVGAELFGHQGVQSDIEVISLMIETLTVIGVPHIHIDLGHVGLYQSIMQEVALEPAVKKELFNAMQRKALPEIKQLIETHVSNEVHARWLSALPVFNGGQSIFERAPATFEGAPDSFWQAVARIQAVADGVSQRYSHASIYLDFSEVRGYDYHTGVVFGAYMPGVGQALALGGRYDDTGKAFGRARPATGFSADMKTVLRAVTINDSTKDAIFAPADEDSVLQAEISRLRASGKRVVVALAGTDDSPKTFQCNQQLIKADDNRWHVVNL